MEFKGHRISPDYSPDGSELILDSYDPSNIAVKEYVTLEDAVKDATRNIYTDHSYYSSNDSFYNGGKRSLTWKRTIEDALTGNKDVTAQVQTLLDKISANLPMVSLNNYIYEVTGEILDVAELVKGVPEHWMQSEESFGSTTNKCIHISVDVCVNCNVKAEDIAYRGALIAALVNYLQTQGYSIKLTTSTCGYDFNYNNTSNKGYVTTVQLLSYGQIPELQRLAFYFAHPCTFRRLGFKLLNDRARQLNPRFDTDATGRTRVCGTPSNMRGEIHIESSDGLFRAPTKYNEETQIARGIAWIEYKLDQIATQSQYLV